MTALSTKPIAALPALLLVVVALGEVCTARHDANAVPDDDAWREAAAVVRAEYRQGDLIVFAPEWVDPVGRMHLGDLISLDMAGRMDAAKYGRIWELSIRGARSHDVPDAAPAFEQRVQGIFVRRYDQTPVTVLADLRDRLPTIRMEYGGPPVLELAEVGFAPHRCLQVVPPPGKMVRVVFPGVPLGGKLVGYVGLADVFTRRDIRAPGKLEIEIAGKVVASAVAGVDDGWVRFEAATTPGVADIAVIASADAPQRLICFAVETRQ